jgi:hypothetical protein
MPLKNGSDPDTVRKNIKEMRSAGHPLDQSIAAALRQAREDHNKDKKKKKKDDK